MKKVAALKHVEFSGLPQLAGSKGLELWNQKHGRSALIFAFPRWLGDYSL